MYPDQEIRALAARKERLLRRIGRRREDLVDAGGRLAEKVALFEHWRERVLRWAGLAWRLVRGLKPVTYADRAE